MATESVIEPAAEIVKRTIDTRVVSAFSGGAMFGIALGFFYGYRYNRKKIRAEVLKEAEKEIETVRNYYRNMYRDRPTPNTIRDQEKPAAEDIVRDRGYSMRVTDEEMAARPLKPPVVVRPPQQSRQMPHVDPTAQRGITLRTEDAEKDKNIGWSYPRELSQRSPRQPYVIHQDEFAENDGGYQQTTYIYYEADDTLADTDNTVLNNRENLIGPAALARFGHGTDDFNLVYVRNAQLELEFEICRVPGSYAHEVLGMDDDDNDEPDDQSN